MKKTKSSKSVATDRDKLREEHAFANFRCLLVTPRVLKTTDGRDPSLEQMAVDAVRLTDFLFEQLGKRG